MTCRRGLGSRYATFEGLARSRLRQSQSVDSEDWTSARLQMEQERDFTILPLRAPFDPVGMQP